MEKTHSIMVDQAEQTPVPGMFYIDPTIIRKHIDVAVQDMIQQSLDKLINDESWILRLQQMVTVDLVSRVTDKISHIDINTVISANLDAALARYHDKIASENFASQGILDKASQCELVVSDGAVVAQSGLACQELLVDQSISTSDLRVVNLAVTGSINTDCPAWNELTDNIASAVDARLSQSWKQSLVSEVLDLAKTQGIDFDTITVKGAPLVQDNRLNNAITESSLQQVGHLRDLTVKGRSQLANTVTVDNRRMGINTDSPDMALSIWDEEVSLSLGKLKQDRAWIGSNRQIALDIGVNRKRSISIEPDGLVSVDRLRVDRWQVSFANAVPNYSGTRGDIVFNHDPKPNTPWAWQCLGGFRWQAMGN